MFAALASGAVDKSTLTSKHKEQSCKDQKEVAVRFISVLVCNTYDHFSIVVIIP